MSRIFIPIILLLLFSMACNDPTEVGTSLVAGDVINAQKKTDFEIDVFQNSPDSLLYYLPLTSDQPSTQVQVGIIDDEFYGRNEASFFLQLLPLQNATDLSEMVLDSVVLQLYYDTTAFYGPTNSAHSLMVHEVSEEINRFSRYYTSQSFDYDPEPIGELLNFPPITDKPVYLVEDGDTTATLDPHIRIHLDPALGERLLYMDSTLVANDSAFISNFKGLYVKTESETGEYLGFEAYFGGSTPTAITVYYKDPQVDTVTQSLNFGALAGGSVVLQNFTYDLGNSLAAQGIADPSISDSLLFMQGNGGVSAGLEIKGLENLGKILVNKALLEFTFNGEILNYNQYDPLESLILVRKDLDGQYINLERPLIGQRDTVSRDPVQIKYIFNIPDYAQKLADGRIFDTRLRLIPVDAMMNPRRSVIFGSLDLNESVRFSLTYTEK
jgi:hypothetical protein